MNRKSVRSDHYKNSRTTLYSYSEGDRFLPSYSNSDVSDDESYSSVPSYRPSFIMGGYYRDALQRRYPFRLSQDVDPTQAVYEGWTVYVPQDEGDSHNIHVAPTSHSQQELAEMHLAALSQYHGTHRDSTGCLPLRRFLRRITMHQSYDEQIDSRIAKCRRSFQDELSYLLQDRSRHSSSSERERVWTVAMLQEQLCHRFTSTKPTPAKRHRLRWWKDNTHTRETEFFVVMLGRETRHEPGGIPLYARYTNPWRAVDEDQAMLEKEAPWGEQGSDFFEPHTNRGIRRPFPRPIIRHRDSPRPPPLAPIISQSPRLDDFNTSYPDGPLPPRLWESELHQQPWFAPHQAPCSLLGLPTPPAPARPFRSHPGPPPMYHATLTPPGHISPSTTIFGSLPPSSLGFRSSPPPSNLDILLPSCPSPPSASWPLSPSTYDPFTRPLSPYGPTPPQPNAYSNLTTPTSLGSIHAPMFEPIPSIPPAVSRSPSPPYPPRSNKEKMIGEKIEVVSCPGSPGLGDSCSDLQNTRAKMRLIPRRRSSLSLKTNPAGRHNDD